MKNTSLSHRPALSLKIDRRLRIGALASILSFGAYQASAQTNYLFQAADGNWNTPANWDQNAVPNDISNTTAQVGSGMTATINGGETYSTGFLYVGSSGVLNITGSGSTLNLGNLGSSTSSLNIAAGGGQVHVTNGATLTATGYLRLGNGVSAAVAHPSLTITKATVNVQTTAFGGSSTDVQPELIINEGGLFIANFTGSVAATNNTTLIFNGGVSGFGQAQIKTMYGSRIGNLAINSGSYVGEGTFTLLDSDNWVDDFTTISFNASAYTLGTEIQYNGYKWNIDRVGNNLMLTTTLIPEASTTVVMMGAVALLIGAWIRRRNARCSR